MTKVLGIKEPDFFKLVKRMNEFNSKNQVFATQVFPIESENLWYALIYYESMSQGKNNFAKDTSFQKPSSSPAPIFKPASKEQIDLIKKLSNRFPELKEVNYSKLSKSDAFKLINSRVK